MAKVESVKIYGLEESIVASNFAMATSVENFDWEVENLKHFLDMDILKIKKAIESKLSEVEFHKEYFSAFYSFGELGCTCCFKYEDYLYALVDDVDTNRFDHEPKDLEGKWDCVKALKHLKRANKLFKCDSTEGHDNSLCGIVVQANITFTLKAWTELQRYNFLSIISSMSTMHRITKMDVEKCCNEYVTKKNIERLNALIDVYNETQEKEDLMRVYYNIPTGLELTARITTNYRQLKTIYKQRRNHRLKTDWGVVCDWIETLPFSEWLVETKEK